MGVREAELGQLVPSDDKRYSQLIDPPLSVELDEKPVKEAFSPRECHSDVYVPWLSTRGRCSPLTYTVIPLVPLAS